MTITAITQVRAAFQRALALAPDRESAIRATAQSLGLPLEAVRGAVGPWCCQIAEAQAVPVCAECDEISAAYSAAMSPRAAVQEGAEA